MWSAGDLDLPIVAAPMAGGPSTAELVVAVNSAGGLGFMSGGYLLPESLGDVVRTIAGATDRPFGVNLFVPEDDSSDNDALANYRQQLTPIADQLGVSLGQTQYSDDHFDAKVALLADSPVAAVTFTFGLPSVNVVDRLHDSDISVGVTVSGADQARAAVERGADFLIVQGPEAGGHRSTFRPDDVPGDAPLVELLAQVRSVTTLPLIAAGGIATPADVAAVLKTGAVAAQIGTALLLTPEAGTKPLHRAALKDPSYDETVVTSCLTGRPARAYRNAFTDRFSDVAPAAYPQVHQLTTPIRSAGDPQWMHLWAGVNHAQIREQPAADIIRFLAGVE